MNRRSVLAAAYLGMLTFGIVLTTLGAVLPSVIERFGIDKAAAGTLFLLMSFGILAGSLVFGPLVDRYGYKWLLVASAALVFLGLEGIAFAPSMGALRTAVLLIGFGGGVINGGVNALVADISAEGERGAAISLLGVFFGVGAVGVPFALGMLLDVSSYTAIIAGVGVVVLGALAFVAATRFPTPKQAQGFPIAEGARLLRDPALLLFGFMLFLESGVELTVGGWTATFFSDELGVTGERALVFLSLYWLGMMLARLALVALLRQTSPVRALLACIGVGLVGSFLMLGSRGLAPAAAGVFLLGVGFAATFPVVLGFVGDRYAHLSGTAFSIAFVMALTGGMLLPYVTGVLGARYGLRTSFLVVPMALVGIVGLLGAAVRQVRSSEIRVRSS
ncbi:MAG: MFS transporter [Gemmatimonadota bacterium]|nr:MFS transporter [Gemmatimonadota bacterium]